MPALHTSPAPQRVRRIAGGNLFRIALEELGDAEQWDRIADLNGLTDPWVMGEASLLIPRRLPRPPGSASAR